MRAGAHLAALATAVCVVAAHAEEFNPYEIPERQFAAQVRTIALRPVGVPSDAPDPEALRARIEALITERVRAKGYTVIPSTAWATVWRQMSERLGGTYDPVTGEPRADQFKAAFEHTTRELERTEGVDALLSAFISIGPAPFGRGLFAFSTWDQPLQFAGQTVGPEIWEAPQSVRGAYLTVVIADLAGTKLYGVRHGIEWTAVFVARGYEERPPAQIYDEPARIQAAVDGDLERLVAAGGEER